MGDQPVAAPIGCGAVVRTLTGIKVGDQPAGAIGLVVGQAPNGPNRYSVMFPGDAFTYSLAAKDVEVLRGLDRQSWWKKQPVQPSASSDAPDQTASEPVVDSELRDQVAQALRQKSCLEYPNRGFGCASPEQHWQAWLDEADAALAVFAPALRKAWLDGHDSGFAAANVPDPWAKQSPAMDDLHVVTAVIQQELELAHSGEGYEPAAVAEEIVRTRVAPVLAARDAEIAKLNLEIQGYQVGESYEKGHEHGSSVAAQLRDELQRECESRQGWQEKLAEHESRLADALGIVGAEEDIDPYEAVVALHTEIDRLRAELATWKGAYQGKVDDFARETARVSAALQACDRSAVPMVVVGEAGLGYEEAQEVIREAIQRAGDSWQPDTEATEQAAQRKSCPECSAQPWRPHRDDCPVTLHEQEMREIAEQPVAPATPTEPRVWRKADPEPAGVSKVRDCMGDIWTLQPFGMWEAPDTRPASWNYMVKKWAPLTEVVDGAPAEDKP